MPLDLPLERLAGEMRPHAAAHDEQWRKLINGYRIRHNDPRRHRDRPRQRAF